LLSAMLYSYLPMVGFYKINFLWAATLPIAALIYMGATLDSALRHLFGQKNNWRGQRPKTLSAAPQPTAGKA